MNRNPKKNSEGYPDPTAYEGLRPIIEEENALERRVNQLIKTLKYITGLAGFELIARIEIKDKETGRIFR
ncbi:MAG: hypothetical protein IJV68_07035 [Clostridia bacterium]|nr:hypothetical protein [Clostridia bacterium]